MAVEEAVVVAAGKKTVLTTTLSVFICILIFVSGFIAGFYYQKNRRVIPGQASQCTLEAKICPDGSAVGREGVNCEFPECPKPLVY